MFHDYIYIAGRKIDMGRAQFLMDKELLRQTIDDLEQEKNDPIRNRLHEIDYSNQWIFEHYCRLHHQKYGEDFIVLADPNWE